MINIFKKLFNWVMGEPVSTHVAEPVKEIQTIHIPKVEPPQSPVKELKRKTSTSATSSVGKLKGDVKDDKVITPIETPMENTTTFLPLRPRKNLSQPSITIILSYSVSRLRNL